MVRAHRSKAQATLLAIALVGTSVLTSCGLRPQVSESSAPQSGAAPAAQTAEAPAPTDVSQAIGAGSVPAPKPQLVRTANLGITVESIDSTIDRATAIARQQQGEVMNLQNQTPDPGEHHVATLQIRVPQSKLDAAIAALSELGAVQQQTLSAEDVSDQLVDHQARLRNLRKAEETVLKIMDRSGDVGDVLQVAQELNNIRQSIEQINAQLNSLQNQVAYSTINLQLESAIAPLPAQPSVQTQLADTWNDATRSIGEFTVALLQIGLWLMIYSPYLLLIFGTATLLYRRRRRARPAQE
ncbi:MAG: DUF4349 domain-containing protein [Microcoleus sp. SIO2G3]|nr:DUF4349 domain-containing protein [Microcoleus sp. SIO2G3]